MHPIVVPSDRFDRNCDAGSPSRNFYHSMTQGRSGVLCRLLLIVRWHLAWVSVDEQLTFVGMSNGLSGGCDYGSAALT